jgi:Mg-chelatase subunit ChlD
MLGKLKSRDLKAFFAACPQSFRIFRKLRRNRTFWRPARLGKRPAWKSSFGSQTPQLYNKRMDMQTTTCGQCGQLWSPEGPAADATCPHCGAPVAVEPLTPPTPRRWWENSISMLASIIFHIGLVLALALWTYGGSGVAGTEEEVLIGQLPGETLTEHQEQQLQAEAVEKEAEAAPLDEPLLEVEPAATLRDASSDALPVTAPSASGATLGGLEFDVAVPGAGGSGGDWEGLIQNLQRNGLDIVILFDSTGSMGGEIGQVKGQIERIGGALLKLVPKAQISLCTYRDEGDDFVVRGIPLSGDIQQLARFLDSVHADGGGDHPEAVHEGLAWAVRQNQFRPRARKVILLFGDAPPHREYLQVCLALASDFRRQHQGLVSTVTCHSIRPLPEFVQISQAGGGESFLTTDERQIMAQLMVLVFGSEHRAKVLEAFKLLGR